MKFSAQSTAVKELEFSLALTTRIHSRLNVGTVWLSSLDYTGQDAFIGFD